MTRRTSNHRMLQLARLADIHAEELDSETWGTEAFQLMRDLERDPALWRQWQLCLALEKQYHKNAASPLDESEELEDDALLSWAQHLVAARRASPTVAEYQEAPHILASFEPDGRWWREMLAQWRMNWRRERQQIQHSLAMLMHTGEPVRIRGDLPPVAVFAEVDMDLQEERCSFVLEKDRVYAFKIYLPTEGYIAVLQVEEQPDDEVMYQLIYPQHVTNLVSMGPGAIHLFSTQFEAEGSTHFLLLFSEEPFDTLSAELWPKDIASWTWDNEIRQKLAMYLLAHRASLRPFLLQVDVHKEPE